MNMASARLQSVGTSDDASRAGMVPADSAAVLNGRWWLVAFVGFEISCQIALFLFGNTPMRLPLRIGNYALSLAFLVLIRGKSRSHPAAGVLPFIGLVFVIEWFNPQGDRLIACLAQTALYASVLAPLLWVGRLTVNWTTFRRVLFLLWFFHTCNALVGVLQVKYPGQFTVGLSENYDQTSLTPHLLIMADGTRIIRPMGLTDVPGGAAVGGVYAIILGMGLLVTERNLLLRISVVAAMIGGLFCIYICQGRTNLVIVAVSAITLVFLLSRRGMFKRVSGLLSILGLITLIGTGAAFATGGQGVVDRFYTLIADDPQTVFYSNRGKFLESMINEGGLEYALGAGMGRWGMMSFYFGGRAPGLWAEMMWQALLYDGGWPLIILYVLLLVAMLRTAWTIAMRTQHDALACWAGVICGYNISAVAASFVFPIFSITLGLEVILLNSCLYACYRYEAALRNGVAAPAPSRSRSFASPNSGMLQPS